MEKIIIAGYPKSGNTWVTRLTAELLNCPVAGFLYQENNPEIAREGKERKSKYVCYKSHHQLKELDSQTLENSKIIYVLRDPRDIVTSGQNYFYNFKILLPNLKSYKLNKIGKKIFYSTFFRKHFGSLLMKKMMLKAIFEGNKKINHWCRISWTQHITPYIENSTFLKIKYEDLLTNPVGESRRILDFIGAQKSSAQINQAIERQSFKTVKKKFHTEGAYNKLRHLNSGQSGLWRKELTKREKNLFQKNLAKELSQLEYKLN